MKEYIERENFYNIESLLMTDIVKENPVAKNILEQLLFDIKEVPAADVKEVIHAKWIKIHGNLSMFFKCSKCGACNEFGTRYCPDCGAKMDLK